MNRGRSIAVLASIAILLGSGALRRRLRDDPGAALDVARAGKRLGKALPESVGAWSSREADVDVRGLERAGIAGLVARRYLDARSGVEVTLVLLCGPAGPIAAHSPESCYPGVGFEPVSVARRVSTADNVFSVWSEDFRGGSEVASRDLRVFWAWGDQRGWSAPEFPRVAFAGAPVLFKAYFLHETATANLAPESDPALVFAGAVLPLIDTGTVSSP